MWYPCSQPPGEANIGKYTLPGVKDCPLPDRKLPLIVVSHGRTGNFVGHHDTDEVLADAGFIVAAINHPGDTGSDLSRTDDLSIYVTRPNDIKRLIDFMLGAPAFASSIDRERIGLFGFSRGGYTALAVIGANPDWAIVTEPLPANQNPCLRSNSRKEFPGSVTHDPRIKAAVIADPLSVFFTANSFGGVRIPVQLWASEFGGDGVLPHSVDIVDKNLPSKHEYHVVPNSGHFSFLAPCPPETGSANPVFMRGCARLRPRCLPYAIQCGCARVLSGAADEAAMKQGCRRREAFSPLPAGERSKPERSEGFG